MKMNQIGLVVPKLKNKLSTSILKSGTAKGCNPNVLLVVYSSSLRPTQKYMIK